MSRHFKVGKYESNEVRFLCNKLVYGCEKYEPEATPQVYLSTWKERIINTFFSLNFIVFYFLNVASHDAKNMMLYLIKELFYIE